MLFLKNVYLLHFEDYLILFSCGILKTVFIYLTVNRKTGTVYTHKDVTFACFFRFITFIETEYILVQPLPEPLLNFTGGIPVISLNFLLKYDGSIKSTTVSTMAITP